MTCIFLCLSQDSEDRHYTVPDLAACHGLQHLMLSVYRASSGQLIVPADRLPAARLRVSVRHHSGQLFHEIGLETKVQVQRVRRLSFMCEPETED